jgi:integrase
MAESITLYDASGNRKFVTREERDRFLRTAATCLGEVRTLCGVLAYTGCHITEALELTFERVDTKRRTLTFESVRKRKPEVFRTVPVPPELIEVLDQVHNVRERRGRGRYRFLWSWGRTYAWRKVREVMDMAGIEGPQAMPKGLRHGFGVIAAENDVPITFVRKWMGHASLEMTTAYFNVLNHDEYACAARLWDDASAIVL